MNYIMNQVNTQVEYNFLKSFIDFGTRFSNGMAFILSTITMIYIIGWVRAETYFKYLNASWILKEFTNITYISYSIFPVIILFSSLLILIILSLRGDIKYEHLKILIIFSFTITFICSLYGYGYGYNFQPNISTQLIYIASISSSITASCLLVLIIISQNNFQWKKYLLTFFTFVMGYGIFLSPYLIGRAEGLRDSNPNTTELPLVHVEKLSNEKLRLLHFHRDVFYLIVLQNENNNSKEDIIYVVKLEDIIQIK